jgi:hypothetical protein
MNIVVIEENGKKHVRLTQSKGESQEAIGLKTGEKLILFCDTTPVYTRYPTLKQVDAFMLAGLGKVMQVKPIVEELLTMVFDLGQQLKHEQAAAIPVPAAAAVEVAPAPVSTAAAAGVKV